ncbi:uncharacterized protein LOC130998100 [Salvia miltiorrhiza]|uniref:uncharacterized protein LOC130998100 n=1 Tax=Salvia miltiorrhiza TaxID=226208 RepID=UPI0025ACADD2|nr:uncharacterized protein LOC130998100 [Salvia miltiorrhiza]
MSSATQGSNGFARGCRTNKTDKKRRSWSTSEQEVLLAALKELVAQGWKSDNGFRAGYLNKLEEAMKKTFPTTDLKGMPHINSKTTTWKKEYYSLCLMLSNSGVGFNVDGKHMIDCTDEQWEAITKKDRNALNMRYKSWPYLDQWREIFGKDRATGEEAKDLMEAAHQMYHKIDLSQEQVDGDYHVSLEDVDETVDTNDSTSQTQKPEPVLRPSSRKRKQRDESDKLFEVLAEIGHGTKERLDTIAGRMGYDYDVSAARKHLFSQLTAIPGLSQKAIFEVTDLLAKEVERLDVFTSLPDEAKADYVYYLLDMINK